MILEVRQVTAGGSNTFEVANNGVPCYRGSASWYPMGVDMTNKVILTDLNGNMVFQTQYSLIDNVAESSIPFKYLFTGEQKFSMYQVLDPSGSAVGSFFDVQMALLDVRLCISFGDRLIFGYRRSMGYREVVSFYENDVQVGQLTRSSKVTDHLDVYYVHFLPQYDNLLPLISMFTVYYDFLFHNNSGQYYKGTTLEKQYTYDKNNDKYNENFIRANFGEAEHARVEAFINRKVEMKVGNLTMKQFWIIFAVGWGVALLLAGVIAFFVLMMAMNG